MRPIPIPDECVGPGTKRLVIGPPDGDLTNDQIRAVEVLAGVTPDLGVSMTMLVALEPGELERLGGMDAPAVWLSMYTPQIPVFSIEVADGRG